MTVLPESPVREYAKRVAGLMQARRDMPAGVPPAWLTNPHSWIAGYRTGLSVARAIVAEEAPLPGTENTYFEYRVVAVDGSFKREVWCDDLAETDAELKALRATFADSQYVIERRTVTATQPVRLDDDGEPTS